MFKKATTTGEPVRIVLLADPSVWEAQLKAARVEVDSELEATTTKGDFIDKVIAIMRATTSTHTELIDSLTVLKGGAREMLQQVLIDDKERESAEKRIDEALQEEDTRQALAYVRAHGAASAYRESSSPADLLDASPEGAAWVELRALSRSQIKDAERSMGPRPSLGAVLSSKALDHARRAVRRGEDSTESYARYLASLSIEEQHEIREYEEWSEALDREVFRRAVHSVEGFDLKRLDSGYPVEEFRAECADAEEVISEVSRHARQLGTLDPKVGWESPLLSGTPELQSEAPA